MATALNDDLFSAAGRSESVEELSLKIESSAPYISREDAAELAEAIQLIRELEREIFLTNEIIGFREKEIPAPKEEEVEEIAEEAALEAVEEVIEELPPEEIILAKQVSEEPEESLPREDKSTIREEKKEDAPQREFIPRPIAPISRPRHQVYSKKELERGKSSAVIEKEQTLLIPAVGLKRFMVTDTEILRAVREDDKVGVTGIALGITFLHIWDSEGRRTVKVRVIQRGYNAFAKAHRRAVEAARMKSFKVRYSYDRYNLKSYSDNPTRSYNYTELFHRLGVTGETPWGMTTSRLQVEEKRQGREIEDQRDITAWDFNLRGEDLEISLGDTGARFSDITLPSTSYQGLRFRNPDKKKINYDFVWGAQGARMWGYKISDWDTANYFVGARGQIEPADFIHFNATTMRALEDEEDIGAYLYAGGVGLNFLDDALKIESEFARGKSEETDLHNHAYKIDTALDLKDYNLLLKGTYRDIDPDFLPVTGATIPHVGELGYYLNAYYNPLKYLRLTGEYNIFRSRYSFNPNEPRRYNYDWRGTVNFDIGPDTRFRYGLLRMLQEGYTTPIRNISQTYNVTHNLSLPYLARPLTLSFRYEPSLYKNLSSSSADYKEKNYTAGMGLNVLKNLYYDISHSWDYRKMLQSGEHGTVRTLSTSLFYSTQILDTPFYGSLRFRYKKEYDVMDNLSLTIGEDVVSGGAELKYRPSNDFETYFRINYQHMRGVLDHDRNREELRIYSGGSYLFDTTLRWGVGGSVRGFVFGDLNVNGRKDAGEGGLAGINVYAGEVRSTVTDSNGRFEFGKIRGTEISVMFDTKMLPEGYKSTTPNPQMVGLERGLISEVDFGVMAVAEIAGRVFNDVNMNGIFDEGDKGTKDILLRLDDGTVVQTMERGHYRMEGVRTEKRELNLDVMTIPPHLVPVTKAKRTIEVKEGKYYEEDFALYALRTVVGTVFIDKNNNNRFDAGEEGIADVEVKVGDIIALTDDAGRYFLKKLKGGIQRVEVNLESIPEGYEIAGDAFREAALAPEGEIREDVDFALRRK